MLQIYYVRGDADNYHFHALFVKGTFTISNFIYERGEKEKNVLTNLYCGITEVITIQIE